MARDNRNRIDGWFWGALNWVPLAALLAIFQLAVAPLQQKVASLEQRRAEDADAHRKDIEALWKALEEHKSKPAHEGIASKVAALEIEVQGNTTSLNDVRANSTERDEARQRELDHVWKEMEDMRSCANGRKP